MRFDVFLGAQLLDNIRKRVSVIVEEFGNVTAEKQETQARLDSVTAEKQKIQTHLDNATAEKRDTQARLDHVMALQESLKCEHSERWPQGGLGLHLLGPGST